MKNAKMIICLISAFLVISACRVFGATEFKDGATHNINYEIKNDVWVDYQAPGMQTTVNMLAGGRNFFPYQFHGYNNGRLNISDGSEVFFLYAYDSFTITMSGGAADIAQTYDSSQLTMSGGSAYVLNASNSSKLTISGGSVGDYLGIHNESLIMWSGGTVTEDLRLEQNGILEINGSNFAVDGIPLGFGEIKSTLGGYYENEPFRTLTGTLANGDIINNQFRIGDSASIVLVPEPVTLLLLGLGGAIVRKRKISNSKSKLKT